MLNHHQHLNARLFSSTRGVLESSSRVESIPTKKPVNRLSTKFTPFVRKSAQEYQKDVSDSIESHKALVEGGYIKQISSGVYTFLPLGTKVLERLIAVIDKSLQKVGCEKIIMPSLLQQELWEETGRWQSAGKELFRLTDRKDHKYCLAPTHEECVTDVVRSLVNSYKQVPLRLYQIGVKFRDELRPRYGLMRAKEFLMKDLYSFDLDREGAYKAYDEVVGAYKEIFDLLGLDYAMVEADTGNIGGDKSHEFQVLSEVGEDFICKCNCEHRYSANIEKGVGAPSDAFSTIDINYATEVMNFSTNFDTLMRVLDELSPELDAFYTCTEPVKHVHGSKEGYTRTVIVTRKGDEPNDIKVKDMIKSVENVEINLADIVPMNTVKDSIKQKSSSRLILMIDSYVDPNILAKFNVEGGGVVGVKAVLRKVKPNDICISNNPGCKNTNMTIKKGIEIGHVFYLGKKYSEPMKVYIANDKGKRDFAEMGCYGIGVSRLFQAIAETHRTEAGICWPMIIAPFRASVIPIVPTANMLNNCSPEEVESKRQQVIDASEDIYHQLNSLSAFKGEILFDDRLKERPPVKMFDMARFGVPYVVVIGKELLESNVVEVQDRAKNLSTKMTVPEAVKFFEQVSAKFEEQMSKF
ncbi:hypothetical protein C9374_004609 [Naegleria lovaniensis]|uniref:Probable proline--tRNA ligase, mitochondrial n=1 Tax=Naegleria lovaniensis TaxID=51637 RepID=A0AA88GS08_NAELO|nr:uncharacterized protein C9374_004609 [Naegleria lovaniensis]KAG2383272.1 hypothetical protein C9374_004609 [Naegleria lovaniensis]